LGFPQLGFCDLPQQQQHAHNLTYKKKIPSHNLHLIQASNANTRRLFVSIAYCLARHREGEDKKKKTKRHKHNNKTQDTKKKRIRGHSCSEEMHLLLLNLLLLHSAMANGSSDRALCCPLAGHIDGDESGDYPKAQKEDMVGLGGRAHWVARESAIQNSSNVAANMAERVLWVRGKGEEEEEEEKEEGATVSVKELQSFTNTDIQSHGAYDKCSSDGVLGSFHNLLGCRS
jgi:hypothetical protein